jgi:tetratricopeptide (TPR) repeat protein
MPAKTPAPETRIRLLSTRNLDYNKRLRQAVDQHQAGNLRDAEALYRAILKTHPGHPDANHNLGVLAGQTRRFEAGLPHLEKAYNTNRKHGQYALSYTKGLLATGQAARALEVIDQALHDGLDAPIGQALRQTILAKLATPPAMSAETQERALIDHFNAGRHAEVETIASQLIAHQPDTGYAWKLLGAALLAQRKEALAALEQAVQLLPNDAHAHNNLGNVLNERGRHRDAEASYRRALALWPDFAEAHNNLGNALKQLGRMDEALASFRRALDINPDLADAHNNLGNAYRALERLEEAEACYHRALALRPGFAEGHNNLGCALLGLGRHEEAIDHYRLALARRPDYLIAHKNLGNALMEHGQFDPSLAHFRAAIQLLFQRLQAQAANGIPFQPRLPRPPMSVTAARATLDRLRVYLDGAGIPWCLLAGTLLGIYRDGDILPYDKDMDLAIPAAIERRHVIDALTKSGEFEYRQRFRQRSDDTYSMSFVHTQQGVTVDLFFLHPDGEQHFIAGVDHPAQAMLCRIRRFEFAMHPWRDRQWPIPATPEQYLEDVYGAHWRQPDPGFDTVLSNPNRLPESIPLVVCYGYERLYECLLQQHWRRALAYCRQLQARRADPLLEGVADWLSDVPEPA